MKEQVPEEMETRVKELTGFGKFQDYRGKLGKFEDFLNAAFTDKKFPYYSDTVANFKRKCKGILGPDLMVLGVQIVQLIRDGQRDFADEVLRALFREDYKLPGEISPGKMVPYTVVMLEPRKTIAAIRWVVSNVFPEELIYLYQSEKRCHDRPLSPENSKVHEALPSLWKYVQVAEKERLMHSNNDFVRLAYAEDVLSKHIQSIAALYRKGGMGLHLNHSCQHVDWKDSFAAENKGVDIRLVALGCFEIPDDLLHFSQYFAFIVKGEQSEVCGMFPREADVATWQLRLPENNFPEKTRFNVGIHEENVHENWRKKWPMFVSKGKAHTGLGAIGIPYMHGELAKEYGVYTFDNIIQKTSHPLQVLFDLSDREFKN